jgi:iron complex transport system permease protein
MTAVPALGALSGRRALRVGPVSTVWRPRALAVGTGVTAVAALLLVLGVGRGDFALPVGEVVRVLAGGGDEVNRVVVLELRLPRALTGALVGLALGISGALTQAVARNPLASPDLLGITAGASTAAVTLIVLGAGAAGAAGTADAATAGATGAAVELLTLLGLPLAALVGALVTAAAVYLLAWREGIDGLRLALVGLGFSALGTAATSYLLLRADLAQATQATVWLTGSLNARGWEHVVPLAWATLIVLALLAAGRRHLTVLQFGHDTVRALGVRVQLSLALVVLAAVVLAAAATAAAGPVAFVALMAPQIALRLVRSAGPPPLVSGLTGAALVLAADLVARTVLPVELPVGIVTAAVGAPYLLYLLVAHNRRLSDDRSARLTARGLTLSYGSADVVHALDLDVLDGGITAIVGPNGCGKSTLLRALGRLLHPRAGQVVLDGRSIHSMRSRDVARAPRPAPPAPVAPEGLTVADLVARGRHPHQSWVSQWSREDERAVAEALAWTGMAELADRTLDELSGGQRQRAWLSMALAQDTSVLLLDEPTTYLDVAHAIDVLDLVDRLHDERGCTVVTVLHDLTLAARYADRSS